MSRRWERTPPPRPTPLLDPLDRPPPAQLASVTSVAAAASVAPHTPRIRARVLVRIRECGPAGRTNEELARELALRMSTVTARVRELTIAGLVRASGQTRSTTSGRKATVWVAAT